MTKEEIIMELEKIRERGYVDYTVQSQHALDMAIKAFVNQSEKPKGHWIKREHILYCSECGKSAVYGGNFCPTCGADMRGVSM